MGIFIKSVTIPQLIDGREPAYLRHDERTEELREPMLRYCFANTAVFDVYSSNFTKNSIFYNVYVLFQDFYLLAQDKDISLEEAVSYAIHYGDVHVRCRCPAFLYWSYAYQATQLKYLYGIPRENRAPKKNNVDLQGTMCKHTDKVLRWILEHENEIVENFRVYYASIKKDNKLVVVNPSGNVIQTGVKEVDGDAHFRGVDQTDLDKAEETNEDVVDTPAEDETQLEEMNDIDIENQPGDPFATDENFTDPFAEGEE